MAGYRRAGRIANPPQIGNLPHKALHKFVAPREKIVVQSCELPPARAKADVPGQKENFNANWICREVRWKKLVSPALEI